MQAKAACSVAVLTFWILGLATIPNSVVTRSYSAGVMTVVWHSCTSSTRSVEPIAEDVSGCLHSTGVHRALSRLNRTASALEACVSYSYTQHAPL